MIKNFGEVKKQLGELSEVVNKFKSEQVQLKIVELVFRGTGVGTEEPSVPESGCEPKTRGRRSKRKGSGSVPDTADSKKRVAAKGNGPVPTLEQFIQEGFFNQKRTIGNVVDHCKTKARNFKEQ